MSLEIYGASDDLIEVEGHITEEFNHAEPEHSYIACSDGTLLLVKYDKDGFWRFSPVVIGTEFLGVVQGTDTNNDYSDKVSMGDGVKWVVSGIESAR